MRQLRRRVDYPKLHRPPGGHDDIEVQEGGGARDVCVRFGLSVPGRPSAFSSHGNVHEARQRESGQVRL